MREVNFFNISLFMMSGAALTAVVHYAMLENYNLTLGFGVLAFLSWFTGRFV